MSTFPAIRFETLTSPSESFEYNGKEYYVQLHLNAPFEGTWRKRLMFGICFTGIRTSIDLLFENENDHGVFDHRILERPDVQELVIRALKMLDADHEENAG